MCILSAVDAATSSLLSTLSPRVRTAGHVKSLESSRHDLRSGLLRVVGHAHPYSEISKGMPQAAQSYDGTVLNGRSQLSMSTQLSQSRPVDAALESQSYTNVPADPFNIGPGLPPAGHSGRQYLLYHTILKDYG